MGSSKGKWTSKSNIARDLDYGVSMIGKVPFLSLKSLGAWTLGGNDEIIGERRQDDSIAGIEISKARLVTGSGADLVDGKSSRSVGIRLTTSNIVTESGDDTVTGTSYLSAFGATPSVGIYMDSNSKIDTGDGNDTVLGRGEVEEGIYIGANCEILMGDGNDLLIGETGEGLWGIYNDGIVSMGKGDDSIKGIARGLFNGDDGIDAYYLPNGVYKFNAAQAGQILIGFYTDAEARLVNFEMVGSLETASRIDVAELMLKGAGSIAISSDGIIIS